MINKYIKFCESLIKDKLFPLGLQLITLILFIFVFLFLYFDKGGHGHSENVGLILVWLFWWTLLPFSFVFFGRIWCAVCPFSFLADFLNKIFKPTKKLPAFFRTNSLYLMVIFFILLTLLDKIYKITSSAHHTLIFLTIIFLGAGVVSIFFIRRSWCRYLCPLGALCGVYSLNSMIALQSNKEICENCKDKQCLGTFNSKKQFINNCPLFEFPGGLSSIRNCNLCGECFSNCRHHALTIKFQGLAGELLKIKRYYLAEVILIFALIGIVFLQTIGMTTFYPKMMKFFLVKLNLSNYNLFLTFLFLTFTILPLVLFVIPNIWQFFKTKKFSFNNHLFLLAYAFIPLVLAGHIAHNTYHLLVENKSVYHKIFQEVGLNLFLCAPNSFFLDIISKLLQYFILITGIVLSFKVLGRKLFSLENKNSKFLIFYYQTLLLFFSFSYWVMITLPMNPLHIH